MQWREQSIETRSRECGATLSPRAVRGANSSNMQRLPQRLQRRLVERLALGRVGVDRAGDVLEPRAHLDRQREAPTRVRTRPSRRRGCRARHGCRRAPMTRTKPSSACFVIARPLARNGKRPVTISPCAAFAASGDKPTATISGSVKQIAGIARWSKARFSPGDDLGDHLALRHGAVGEHRLAGHVADRPDVAHRGRRSGRRCGRSGPAIARSRPSRPKPSVRGRRPTATRTFSAGNRRFDAVGAGRSRARPRRSRAPARRAMRLDPEIGERGARPAESAPRRRAAGSSARPRRSSPWRRAWRRPCRAPCRYSPPRPRRASRAPWSAPAPRSRRGRPRRRTAAPASGAGSEPVAMTRCSQTIRWSPVSAWAIALLPSTIVARPRKERTPAFLSSAPTPVASRATIASFQAIVLAKSSEGGAERQCRSRSAPAARSAHGRRRPRG